MNRRMIAILIILIFVTCNAGAQDRTTVTSEELIESFGEAVEIGEAVIATRTQLANEEIPIEGFAREISRLQRRCEPIMILIATTNPPREIQRFAMMVAIGAKGVELGLWYYIYGALSSTVEFIKYGDGLVEQGYQALQSAQALLDSN